MRTVAFLLYDRFQLLDVSGPLQVFSSTNDELQRQGKAPLYKIRLCAATPGPQRSTSGVSLDALALPHRSQSIDSAIVPGGPGARANEGDGTSDASNLVPWLRRHGSKVRRIAAVCTGSFVLARAGLLDGCKAVTHWAACDQFRREFPQVDVQPDAIYFRDGRYWTSAGITAGIDMALGMVEEDGGRPLAMKVAKHLVMFYKRPGGQSQFSSALLTQTAGDERIEQLHAWIEAHLQEDLALECLAERLAMTRRSFSRFYANATGTTPGRAVERMRLEKACRLIETRRSSLKSVAQQCGFSSEEIMRRSFIRHLQVSPSDYRTRFSHG